MENEEEKPELLPEKVANDDWLVHFIVGVIVGGFIMTLLLFPTASKSNIPPYSLQVNNENMTCYVSNVPSANMSECYTETNKWIADTILNNKTIRSDFYLID